MTTEIANYNEELARYAAATLEAEKPTGGKFFSLKSGQLSWGGEPLPSNQMAVIVLSSIFENTYYQGEYDPDVMRGPTCYAFASREDDLAPHADVLAAGQGQADKCKGCPKNEFGSAERGSGKACKNSRRLSVIPAGTYTKRGDLTLFEEEHLFASAEVGYLKLPVTSVKNWASYARGIAQQIKKPVFAVVTNIRLEPDPKTQFKVQFELIQELPDEFIGTVLARVKQAEEDILFPYELGEAIVETKRKF